MQFFNYFTFFQEKKTNVSLIYKLILLSIILIWPIRRFWFQEGPAGFVLSSVVKQVCHVTEANISLLSLTSQETETPSGAPT